LYLIILLPSYSVSLRSLFLLHISHQQQRNLQTGTTLRILTLRMLAIRLQIHQCSILKTRVCRHYLIFGQFDLHYLWKIDKSFHEAALFGRKLDLVERCYFVLRQLSIQFVDGFFQLSYFLIFSFNNRLQCLSLLLCILLIFAETMLQFLNYCFVSLFRFLLLRHLFLFYLQFLL
jgi:hypothetical protein